MNHRLKLVTGLLALLILVLAGCGKPVVPSPSTVSAVRGMPVLPKNAFGFMGLSVTQLAESMAGKNFILVNVHVPNQMGLPNTDLAIPFDQIASDLDKLPGKDEPIVLYCRSGSMSGQAAMALAALGYTRVYSLVGGFDAWKAAGLGL